MGREADHPMRREQRGLRCNPPTFSRQETVSDQDSPRPGQSPRTLTGCALSPAPATESKLPDRLVFERLQNRRGVQDEVHHPTDVTGPVLRRQIIAEGSGRLELPAQVHR